MTSPEGAEHNYLEIPPTRAINSNASFLAGTIDVPFSLGAPNVCDLSKSYFRIELELKGPEQKAPSVKDQVAFADNAADALFVNTFFRMGGQDASSITSQQAQASMVKNRLMRTSPFLKSIANGTHLDEADFSKRIIKTSRDSIASTGISDDNETYRGTITGAQWNTATMSIVAATMVCTASVDTFTATVGAVRGDEGSTLYVNGSPFTIVTVNSVTEVVLDGAVAADTGTVADWYMVRRNLTRSTAGRNRMYVYWQPPIGVFSMTDGHQFAAGDYRLQLVGNQNFEKAIVQTLNPESKVGLLATDSYSVIVHDLQFYLHVSKMAVPDIPQTIHLMEFNVQPKTYAANLQFSVPSSTNGLTFFLQDTRAGANPVHPLTQARAWGSEATNTQADLKLQSLQVTYANTTKTVVPYQSNYDGAGGDAGLRNTLQQRYHDSLVEAGLDLDCGAETFDDWLRRGTLIHFSFERDVDNRSTEVQVRTTYSGALPTYASLFCVAHYRKTINYTVSNGLITSVQMLEI